jgi:predicted nucleic acid-binding protein
LKALPRVILVDANFIVAYVSPKTNSDDRARIDHFMDCAEKAKSKIVFPMPAIAEFLVGADLAGVEFLNRLDRKTFLIMADFNRAAAFELAQIDRAARNMGDKKDETTAPWQKIKVDRQIVAIGKSMGAALVISGDGSVRNNALRIGMQGMTIQELELPEGAKQGKLALVPVKRARIKKPEKGTPEKLLGS